MQKMRSGGPYCPICHMFCLLDLGHGQDGLGDDRNVWIRYVVLRMQYWKQAEDRSRTCTGGIEPSGENESMAHARLLQCCPLQLLVLLCHRGALRDTFGNL